jgi:hypothetical protein
MKKLLLLSALFIFGCSNTPEKNIFVWNYSTNYDELDEKTIFKSKVYSTTQTNFDWPYGDARYFLEIKTIIPDNIKTFDDYLYYSSRTQTNLINIKCSECPSYAYGRNSLKYKIDKKKPGAYTGYTAVRDNDELDKYSFLPDIGADWFVKNILGEQNYTNLLIEFPTSGAGNKQISFNISNFNLLDVIKRNHFNDDQIRKPKTEKVSSKQQLPDPDAIKLVEDKVEIVSETALITVDNLNFRSTPEISDNIIGKLKINEKIIYLESISINKTEVTKGTLNKIINIDQDGKKFTFNKYKAINILGPNGDYELAVSIPLGNGKDLNTSILLDDIDLIKKEVWAKIEQGSKTGYVYYKFLNFDFN